MAMEFSVPLEVFRFLWDHQAHTGKALVLQLPGCVAPIPWELLPWMDKPPEPQPCPEIPSELSHLRCLLIP